VDLSFNRWTSEHKQPVINLSTNSRLSFG